MSARDSGIIDLFAIHTEESARVVTAAPSAPPPAVSFDRLAGEDDDVDAFAAAQEQSRKRAKWIGGAVGGIAVLGILITLMASGGGKNPSTAAVVSPPAPAPVVAPSPPPSLAPVPLPVPSPPATAKAEIETPDYTRATAARAYKASKGKGHGHGKKAGKAVRTSAGATLTKVQSAGVAH